MPANRDSAGQPYADRLEFSNRTSTVNRILTSNAPWASWNPTTGCTKVSDACVNCYADTTARFLQSRNVPAYSNGFLPVFHPSRLNIPDSYRSPRRIFVDSMSDLFHEEFSDEQILEIFSVMQNNRRHTYFVLTKRPERMHHILGSLPPMPHVWIGVTVESDTYAWRAEYLCDLQHRFITFVNCEPLLGPIESLPTSGIDVCFAAKEAGPHRRPSAPEWFTSLEHYCVSNNIRYIGHRFDIRTDAGKRPILP